MNRILKSNRKQFTLALDLVSTKPTAVKVEAQKVQTTSDGLSPVTYYYRQEFDINGSKHFEIPFPQSPNELIFKIYPAEYKNYNHYMQFGYKKQKLFDIAKSEIIPLKTKLNYLTDQDKCFIKFIKKFCDNASIHSSSHDDGTPSIYRSDCGGYTIDYYDKIRDDKGKELNTPARIGHDLGNIEVSQRDFVKYTIPMRMIILLHEYAHKWRNPDAGLQIGDESGADIGGLLIYLCLGYSPIEAHQAFLEVFYGARTPQNHARYLIIDDFIKKFENDELDEYYK